MLFFSFKRLDGQCSGMSCAMKYNCCQQSDLCPKNKICKPINSLQQPWKRFTCECPDGYYGDNCDQPITSCQGYAHSSWKSGRYNVVDFNKTVYEVYCHFNSDGVWTLVQSYNLANGSSDSKFQEFLKPLRESHPVSENAQTWNGYRLSKTRMKSIKENSSVLMFTCDYEKQHEIKTFDFVQVDFEKISVDILELNTNKKSRVIVEEGRGRIGNVDASHCEIYFKSNSGSSQTLFVLFKHTNLTDTVSATCKLDEPAHRPCQQNDYAVFLSSSSASSCIKQKHHCKQSENSTTQLWFGTSN